MKTYQVLALGILLGGLATLLFTAATRDASDAVPAAGETQPLYWVAPMDPDYRRDSPGKSPMGMDLVPVYADSGNSDSPGTIRISPDVVNNLGVRTATAEVSEWDSEIRTVGYVTYDEDQLLHIHPRVSGWVETLHVKAEGDPVAAGQALYELYSPELVNAQEELLLATKRQNARLIKAARDRLSALQMSDEFVGALERKGEVAQTVTFRARQGGVVDNLAIREGFYVQPGTTMLSIGTLDEVWVSAEVFERQAAAVQVGMPVTMTSEFIPGETWEGSVDYVYPTLDPETRTVRVRLKFANQDQLLKPNMFAQVAIHASTGERVLTVPREAVIRTAAQDRVVLALGAGRFKSVSVQIGRVSEQSIEILSGIKADDLVVASAQFLLDSESSKTSDFLRFHHNADEGHRAGMNHD